MNKQIAVSGSNNTNSLALNVAVIICTHNRPTALERCLERLLEGGKSSFSIFVVDSAPNSSEAKSVVASYGVGYVASPSKGLSRARNIGTRATHADIIAYLDDDMVPHTRWLTSLVAEFADKDVMVATGPVLPLEFTDGSDVDLQLAVELAPWGMRRFQIGRSEHQWFERTNFGGIGDGNFALRRSVFDKIGGFDERLGRGAMIDISEEHYAFFKIVECGFKVAYTPQAIVFHPSSPITRAVLRKRIGDAVAFAAFLVWNRPLQSWRVAKYLVEGIFRIRRWWHPSSKSEVILLSAREKCKSGMLGLSIFLRSVRQTPK
jgi:O-antigen biosynthesis protein